MYSEPLKTSELEMSAETYDGVKAYARAKRAQVTLSAIMAEKYAAQDIHVHAMHPGWTDTPGLARSLPGFRKLLGSLLRTPEEGADTLIWLAASNHAPLVQSGKFWLDRTPRAIHKSRSTRLSDTPQERERLWAKITELGQLHKRLP
jgi:dehydrogenase/reductase SDR family member 12